MASTSEGKLAKFLLHIQVTGRKSNMEKKRYLGIYTDKVTKETWVLWGSEQRDLQAVNQL